MVADFCLHFPIELLNTLFTKCIVGHDKRSGTWIGGSDEGIEKLWCGMALTNQSHSGSILIHQSDPDNVFASQLDKGTCMTLINQSNSTIKMFTLQ